MNWRIEFVLLAAIWGASFLLMRGGAHEFGPFATAFLRTLIASASLLPLLLLRGQLAALRAHGKRVLLIGLVNSAIPFFLFGFAVLHINTGLAGILNATTPMFGAFVAWAWLHDRLDATRALGLALGFVGVFLLAGDSAGLKTTNASWALAGIAACLLAALCYGIAASLSKLHLTGVPPLVSATGSQLGATLGLALPALFFWPEKAPSSQAWLCLAGLGIVCTAVAYLLYFRLIERAGPARATTVTFLIPVFAVAYGALLLSEKITLSTLGFGTIVVLGTALATGVLKLKREP